MFIAGVEDAIYTQLKAIRDRPDGAALFAQKVRPARSTEIHFPVDGAPHSTNSKHEPDASFWHDDAQYPGVIIEVAYSQKRKRLDRLAEDYLLDSDASDPPPSSFARARRSSVLWGNFISLPSPRTGITSNTELLVRTGRSAAKPARCFASRIASTSPHTVLSSWLLSSTKLGAIKQATSAMVTME